MKEKLSILVINKSPSLSQVFTKAIREQGFEVLSFFELPAFSYKRSSLIKYKNIFRRIVYKDIDYLQRVENQEYEKYIIKNSTLLKDQKFDYVLFFRADLFPKEMIANIRKLSKNLISYQYDGMEVCKNILHYTSYFDKIFVFDQYDLITYKKYNFLPLTNCWFPDGYKYRENRRDFFYVGVGIEDRKKGVLNFQKFIESENWSMDAILTIPHFREEFEQNGVEFSHQGLSYEENMDFVKSSNALLDFKLPYHEGLSFRFFEAMNYEKKIITNNFSVKNYDFYHPNNIFICDFEDFSGLQEFMAKPYHKIEQKIVDKYGIENWLKYVLDLEGHQKIDIH